MRQRILTLSSVDGSKSGIYVNLLELKLYKKANLWTFLNLFPSWSLSLSSSLSSLSSFISDVYLPYKLYPHLLHSKKMDMDFLCWTLKLCMIFKETARTKLYLCQSLCLEMKNWNDKFSNVLIYCYDEFSKLFWFARLLIHNTVQSVNQRGFCLKLTWRCSLVLKKFKKLSFAQPKTVFFNGYKVKSHF